MPAQRPRAAFEPIPPNLDVAALVDSTPNFEYVVRIDCNAIDEHGLGNFEKLVRLHVILGGKPLVVEGFHERLDHSVFSETWLRMHHSDKTETARNLSTKSNLELSIGHYLKNMPLLANRWTSLNYKDPSGQRIYLKDIDCPQVWHDHLRSLIPPPLFYLNKHPEAFQGPGAEFAATSNDSQYHPDSKKKTGKPGDLMSCLPPSMRAENLMCYIGHEGTYTPAHQEMCASLGQNIMVEASSGSVEYGMKTKPGSSIWFMTESKDRGVVSEYWQSTLGHDIDIEDHFAQINAWRAAPFKTYIVEQKPGDFILIPPLAAHQVWNRGTRTMKVAWNRTTVETLGSALNESLPHARMVCRDEQYKNKAIVYYALEHYSQLLQSVVTEDKTNTLRQILEDFDQLFALYTQILLSESFYQGEKRYNDVEYIPFDSNITCSYCRCNIFNRFLTCPWCVGADGEDTYDICMECYVMGRSCACISRLRWAEQFRWSELTEKHEEWRIQICQSKDGQSRTMFGSLTEERSRYGKKTLAEICQEQLTRRPWIDITKPVIRKTEDKLSDTESVSPARKRRKTRLTHEAEDGGRCHICKYIEPTWKLASCSYCNQNYCYGSLFRAFNIQPRDTMEVYYWKCPKCQKICSCAACRRDPAMNPFEPKSLLLGHDTRKIADPRSVESLVDFRQSNLRWLKKAGDDEIGRLKKHQKDADDRRHQAMIEHCIQLEESPESTDPSTDYGDIPVDPALEKLSGSVLTTPGSISW
ncbi:putative JmjC domain protein [Aspergillus clavatus NRRL 1]|uniref:JmjC domain protein, putative n=1 Tax=Aspergillus clavatus (strain ATCC 1007 / CBS 513.65 / DSM 816 / NCTC 3887 / NRRL 1 / QM 1276 / 107) TaxID=344612 RepID=A1CGQ6_ASPCL|nr:JmjC domain protein, putative [Aspergillus clavatus NRRL 1]EAW10061.1 JmjC domain protein, putative [Aspergillus clavatus NRRL 1]